MSIHLAEPATGRFSRRPHDAAPDAGAQLLGDGWSEKLRDRFDAVVMLTWSDWHKEPRSNRYHYASRFARHLPVIFVQPMVKAQDKTWSYEPTGLDNVTLLHFEPQLYNYPARQIRDLGQALRERNIRRPLLWIYNPHLRHFARSAYAGLKVYHATEDYFGDSVFANNHLLDSLKELLRECDMLVAVSSGVAREYRKHTDFRGRVVVANNGCDYGFFAAEPDAGQAIEHKTVFYQGGINYRLDFRLMHELACRLSDWQFCLCGRLAFGPEHGQEESQWFRFLQLRNVKYLGNLPPEEVRRRMHQATVGIIPFGDNISIRQRSFPLKAFEYVACGLPVVSIPVAELEPFPEVFTFAEGADAFAEAVTRIAPTRRDPELLQKRHDTARAQSYDARFALVAQNLEEAPVHRPDAPLHLKLLVLYDAGSTHVKTIEHHLRSFRMFSDHEVYYAPATGGAPCPYDLSHFDAVVLHYCIRVCVPGHLSPEYTAALRSYPGLKILFAQDEYDHTNITRQAIDELGIQLMYTCVPMDAVAQVYPPERFGHVDFQPTLTGYVPLDLGDLGMPKPLHERSRLIGYRGRDIGWWYGDLCQEKLRIGQGMKAICERLGVAHDIAWDNASRIYGPAWFDFLRDCRATLGTESGSNVFDFDGQLKRQVEDALKANPNATYKEIHDRFLKDHEGRIVQNQVSPKLFEAIALRCALVLFEGNYSGVVKPWVHYLPLKKDFSNAADLIHQLQNDDLVQTMTERAYQDVVESGRFSYPTFVEGFEQDLHAHLGRGGRSDALRPPPIQTLRQPDVDLCAAAPIGPLTWIKHKLFGGLRPVYRFLFPSTVRRALFPRLLWLKRWLRV